MVTLKNLCDGVARFFVDPSNRHFSTPTKIAACITTALTTCILAGAPQIVSALWRHFTHVKEPNDTHELILCLFQKIFPKANKEQEILLKVDDDVTPLPDSDTKKSSTTIATEPIGNDSSAKPELDKTNHLNISSKTDTKKEIEIEKPPMEITDDHSKKDTPPPYYHTVKDIEEYVATIFSAANDTQHKIENDLKGRIKKLNLDEQIETELLESATHTSKVITESFKQLGLLAHHQLQDIFGDTIEIARGKNPQIISEVRKLIHLNTAYMMNEIKVFHDQIEKEIQFIQCIETEAKEPSYFDQMWNLLGYQNTKTSETEIPLKTLYSIFNATRMENILKHDFWTKGWDSEPLLFEELPPIVCSFRPAFEGNGAYSSAALRNRSIDKAVIPNFHRTTCKPKDPSISLAIPGLDCTRSASPFESGLDDPNVRLEVTKHQVKQILTHHAKAYIAKKECSGLKVEQNETISFQWVSLLTDSWMVKQLADYGFKPRIDNEFEMLETTIKALEFFQDQDFEVDGKSVKFDIKIWNAPCNDIQDALSSAWNSLGPNEQYCNSKARISMDRDVEKKIESINSSIETLKVSQDLKEKIENLIAQKHAITDPSKSRLEWQKYADELCALTCYKNRSNLNTDDSAYLKLIEERECIRDLQKDISALLDNSSTLSIAELDYNHHMLSSRLLNMGTLLGYAQHFGCRSGKDRTAMADIEAKLLTLVIQRLGRCPTYWEQEHLPFIKAYRNLLLKKSGNIDIIQTANVGANLGINILYNFNSPAPKEKFDPQEFEEQKLKLVGAYELFERAIH